MLKFVIAAGHYITLSSAKRRLKTGIAPSLMVVCGVLHGCSRELLMSTGERKQPCRKPNVVLKNSPLWLFNRTALSVSLFSMCMTLANPSSMLNSPS